MQQQPQQQQQQQQQQQSPQQINQSQSVIQQSQQQQQTSNAPPLLQRLKPILKRTTISAQPTIGPTVTPSIAASNTFNNNSEIDYKPESIDVNMQDSQPRWPWKIPRFKVNKKLKRLRMNQRLRKTLQPKNAIMVLNEIKTGVQFTFPETQGHMPNLLHHVHAELDGETYVGEGVSKPLARQNAAENALKALLGKMTVASMKARLDAESDGQITKTCMDEIKEENDDSNTMDTNSEDEIPWSSLASFALHKLFLEWHNQSVPVPRPGLPNAKEVKKENPNVKTPTQKELPPNPTNMHPVMLLNQMRPGLKYAELSRVGNHPPNTMFTVAVEIAGIEYSGTAKNKKDAKKAAAKAALLALYNLTYPEDVNKQDLMVID
ncbi:PREDICTED: double-stranded RNA-specific editase 1-like [Cyphomyrmex costatus]|uniref:Double-stranded RNA-specific editase 1 n=1 Tax=Cyphomyrmex costatus TaxID=456900 RepID=A0A151IA13_9HYME|nr:PREDICTED: double-stranded RNA-specific editase 1-like [Cyphomyrmex costatus]KYM95888.1 Double-stranded RNA-specific editase 1 [Cyphomyrmex costatus]